MIYYLFLDGSYGGGYGQNNYGGQGGWNQGGYGMSKHKLLDYLKK